MNPMLKRQKKKHIITTKQVKRFPVSTLASRATSLTSRATSLTSRATSPASGATSPASRATLITVKSRIKSDRVGLT